MKLGHMKSRSTDRNIDVKLYETILSREDLCDYDEGRDGQLVIPITNATQKDN